MVMLVVWVALVPLVCGVWFRLGLVVYCCSGVARGGWIGGDLRVSLRVFRGFTCFLAWVKVCGGYNIAFADLVGLRDLVFCVWVCVCVVWVFNILWWA